MATTNVSELAQLDTSETMESVLHVQTDALHVLMLILAILVFLDRISKESFASLHAIVDTLALLEFARNALADVLHAQLLINANHAQMDSY